ncbi:uncharacterized protein CC84DRAFT_859919 [Paraphaeosphaeria sporulosa]|uniref:Uncharacterized protein n=1 Tax=Paraphaeosphaeria sporulosa TaxID=1460663 RepID=A0A177CA17_9PLEO|nr:uncharacterized protein CC84DRAFT_859919 [Paraphaeosphaeria sporulosa]OAG03570.1 hypothetical protein CC84DRAFT_859919 [Paraphaeosphaeria sporulosa]
MRKDIHNTTRCQMCNISLLHHISQIFFKVRFISLGRFWVGSGGSGFIVIYRRIFASPLPHQPLSSDSIAGNTE